MTDGVVAFDHTGRLIHRNPAAATMLGRTLGRTAAMTSSSAASTPWSRSLPSTGPTMPRPSRWWGIGCWSCYLAPFSSDQEKGGVLIVLHDVTEQHRNEERRKEFVANVSHELRTPLTNVRSYAETLPHRRGRHPPGDGEQLPGHHHQRDGPHDPHRPGPSDPQPPGRRQTPRCSFAPFSFRESVAERLPGQRHGGPPPQPHPHLHPGGEHAGDQRRPPAPGAGGHQHAWATPSNTPPTADTSPSPPAAAAAACGWR